jgi:glutathione peroxidase
LQVTGDRFQIVSEGYFRASTDAPKYFKAKIEEESSNFWIIAAGGWNNKQNRREAIMVHLILKVVSVLFISVVLLASCKENAVPVQAEAIANDASSIYDFVVTDIDGKEVNLQGYAGKVLLIVNVASKCGFTPQYEGLQALFEKYQQQGFVVLGFPANNFLGQEPGTNQEIKQFCSLTYGVSFPMFSKISVKGDDIAPLYAYLTDESTNPEFAGDISWNFNKFLIGRDGTILNRFGSRDSPESEKVVTAIEEALERS